MTAPTQYAGDLYAQAAKFQDAVEALDKQSAQALTNAWAQVYGRIRVDLDDVLGKIAHAKATGQDVKPGWLYQQNRLKSLLGTTKTELARYGTVAGVVTKGAQASAVLAGVKHAKAQASAAVDTTLAQLVGEFHDVDPANLKHLVGHLSNGSPLRDLFDEIPGDGARELERRLVQGVGLGWNAARIGKHVETGLLLSRQRAILISRTETLRAYREASRASYLASDVVTGWVWVSALDRRTCVACVAMHGTEHPKTERLDGHPACRCRMVPRTVSYADLGLPGPDTNPPIMSGANWLAGQSPLVQQAILGKGKFDLYSKGEASLADMVRRTHNPRWGTMRSERPIKDIKAGVNGDYGPHLKGQPTPREPTPVTHLPRGYYGVDLPEGYYGVDIPVTHPAKVLPQPTKAGVDKVLAKLASGTYTEADLTKIVATGKYKNSAKPLKPQDYAAHKLALEVHDANKAKAATVQANQDALSGKVDTEGLPPPVQAKVDSWLQSLNGGNVGVDDLEILLGNLPDTHSGLQNKANVLEAISQYKAKQGLPDKPGPTMPVTADPAKVQSYLDDLKSGEFTVDELHGLAVDKKPETQANIHEAIRQYEGQAGLKDWPEPPFDVDTLKVDPSVNLGGAHSKTVFTDADGNRWLYKPQDEFRATLDRSVAAIQDAAGLKAPKTYTVTIQGRVGSIQELLPSRNAFGDSPSAFDVTKLAAHDVLELQKHDLFDWMISNHDGHAQQYIRGKGPGSATNPIIGIDKGQGFRFFGQDRLDVDYEPNAGYGVTKVSNILNRAYAEGKPVNGWSSVADQGPLREFAERLVGMSDAEYRAMLRPYAEQAAARGMLATGSKFPNDVDAFLRAATDRKRGLLNDYTQFHDALRDRHDKALGIGKYAPPKVVPKGLRGMDESLEDDRHQSQYDTPHEGHAKASAMYPFDKMRAALTEQMRNAITKYTGSSYGPVNNALRGIGYDQPSTALTALANRVQAAAEAVPLTQEMVVHRAAGLGAIEAMAKQAGVNLAHSRDVGGTVGHILTDRGFMSSSVGQFPKYGDRSVVLKIRAPEGTPAVYVSNGLSSQGNGEYEMVLGKGLSFHVHAAYQSDKYYRGGWVMEVEIIPTTPVKKPVSRRRKATP